MIQLQTVAGSVPLLVDYHARTEPHAVAVIDDNVAITYGQLAFRSNALSAYLRTLGVTREAVVAVCLPRSVAQVVAALAVMKAGAAYLPLDPAQPTERLGFALRNAGAGIALIAADGPTVVTPAETGRIPLAIDGRIEGVYATVADPADVAPTDLAYVIYTSGSTGEPKGVEITHGGLTNLTAWHQTTFRVTPADRASHISAVGFDAAVWEVWPYLCAGASVHIAGDAVARDPRALRDWLLSNAITIAFASTPLAERLIEFDYPPRTSLRILLTGADVLHRYPPAALPFVLYNNYGPTESTVVATSGRIDANDDDGGLPSIGRPIDNIDILILNENGVRQAAGVDGEICITGDGLARGYRARPELTAEKFRWVSFDGEAPIRIYRTGDRGRRSADGRIAYLGRIDDQLKIRGFRVEPREIESALNAFGRILESAVIVREFSPGDERLVAYVVARPGQTLERGEIQAFLATRLPAYMIPATYVGLPALPTTSNGKVDRADLRAREIEARLGADAFVAPRTATEERLVRIVAPLLKLERVSVADDFFKLGGHSLLGTQLIARLRDAFGIKIGLRFLFESPTISALAVEVERLLLERLESGGATQSPAAVRVYGSAIPKRRP